MAKKILYLDLDGTVIDFESGINRLTAEERSEYAGRLDEVPGIFALMDPMPGAVAAVHELAEHYDVYFLSTAPWDNPTAWSDKLLTMKRYFGDLPGTPAYKRLILSHQKQLNVGDFLIDDRPNNGAAQFAGTWIKFGAVEYPDYPDVVSALDWDAVLALILPAAA